MKHNEKEIYQFIDMLIQLLENDLPLSTAADMLAKQKNSVAQTLYTHMKKGETFSQALIQLLPNNKKTYTSMSLYMPLIEAGESSGSILAVLQDIKTDFDVKQSLQTKLTNTLCYPAVVIFVACIATLLLLLKGIPLFKASGFMTEELYVQILHSIYASVIALISMSTVFIASYVHSIRKESVYYRLFYILHLLIKAAVPFEQALIQCLKSMRGIKECKAILSIKDSMADGCALNEAFRQTGFFPHDVIIWLELAEKQGTAQEIFRKLSLIYYRKDERRRERLVQLAEPISIVITGIYVALLLQGAVLPLLTNFGGI